MNTKDITPREFTILHLSDLHIVPHGDKKKRLSTVLDRMIDHIAKVTENDKTIIITFTGDLVEQAKFDEAEETIILFFKKLTKSLDGKIVDAVFTPGNHDKERGNLVLKPDINLNDENFSNTFRENDWNYFEKQFEKYMTITEKIQRDIFNIKPQEHNTYGIKVSKVGSLNLCFMYINSAWSSIGKFDEGNLQIGRFQLDDLMGQYQNIKADIDLVIAIMHHPSDWLTKSEQKYLNRYITDEYRLNTNIMLQGHIHEKETYNWYNQNHSITTLVTGMGWDQQKEINDGGHRYSLYRINMDSGIVKVNTYVTDNNGQFGEDTALYNGKNIIFPLYIHKYLELNNLLFKNSEVPLFYPNYNSAENIQKIFIGLNNFCIYMMKFLEQIRMNTLLFKLANDKIKTYILNSINSKSDLSNLNLGSIIKEINEENFLNFLQEVETEFFKTPNSELINKALRRYNNDTINNRIMISVQTINELNLELDKFFKQQFKIYMKDQFYAFIGQFCMQLCKKLFQQSDYSDNDTLRIHFRKIFIENNKVTYEKLFAHYATKKVGENKLSYMSGKETQLSSINYSHSLIEKSFNQNKTLLSSLNPSSNSHVSKNDWIDFITTSPNIECNKYIHTIDYENVTFPYLSFGISVNNTKFQQVIRGMAYIGFEKVLSRLLTEFFNISSLKINDLLQ